MNWKTFKIGVAVLLGALAYMVLVQTSPPDQSFELASRYLQDSIRETASQNVVTGIYLDYRVYDSLFESLLLLIGAVGIHYLNKEETNERK